MTEYEAADAERYPLLTEHGRRMLEFLREHPHAPIYRNQSGNRLTAEDLEQVRAFERDVERAEPQWTLDNDPAWLTSFIRECLDRVAHYRDYQRREAALSELPTTSRGDLSRDIAAFVPDDVAIERLLQFSTSGTTGHPLLVPSHPVVAASYLAFHKKALRHFGIELTYGRGQVGVVLVGFQKRCFSYVSVTPQMDESGLAKINLHPEEWRDPADRARYLDALDPEMYTGDPLAFAELSKLPLSTRPRALLSTSMVLSPALREALEQRFGCPVIDVYSMNEAGPIAFAADGLWRLLQPRLFVEILDEAGNRLEPGERGEVTLTGGFNPWLPLLRYRTGDHAALVYHGRQPRLSGLSGRAPVRFRSDGGEWLNNIEVTHAVGRFALAQWTLHQSADGSLEFHSSGGDAATLERALADLFGAGARISVDTGATFDGKVSQYTSDLEGGAG
jgi:phenylacetate-CoA ligase